MNQYREKFDQHHDNEWAVRPVHTAHSNETAGPEDYTLANAGARLSQAIDTLEAEIVSLGQKLYPVMDNNLLSGALLKEGANNPSVAPIVRDFLRLSDRVACAADRLAHIQSQLRIGEASCPEPEPAPKAWRA